MGVRKKLRQARSALRDTMIRLLAAVQTLNNPFLHSVQTDWCYTDSGPPEPKIITALLPARLFLPMPPLNPFLSGRAQPPKRERLGFPANLRGARAWRTRRPEGRGLRPLAREAPPRRARGVSSPGAINLPEIRDLVPGSSVGNSS